MDNFRLLGLDFDFEVDPYTSVREFLCPNCGHYLLTFLIKLMEKTNWIPKTQRVLSTGCNRNLKLAYGDIESLVLFGLFRLP